MDRELYLYDEIGGFGITASAFIAQLNDVPEADPVTIRINSPGGSITEGMAIFNALTRRKKVTCEIDGLAASIASVIALAGGTVRMAEGAMFLIHNASLFVEGDPAELRKGAETLQKFQNIITAVYVRRTGIDASKITAWMTEETCFTAAECKALGFVDEIVPMLAAAAKLKPEWAAKFRHLRTVVLTPPAPSMESDPAPAAAPEPTEQPPILPDAAPAPEPEKDTPAAEASAVPEASAEDVAAITARINERDSFRARAESAEAKNVALEARAAVAETERDRYKGLFSQLKSSLGLMPAQTVPVIIPAQASGEELLKQVDAITDAGERARFIQKNKAALRAANLSRMN